MLLLLFGSLTLIQQHVILYVPRISLYRNAEKIPPSEHFIVQEYIDKPLLLDGYKFDLRIYVLVTSCDPLRVFLFNDGLVRLATEKYLPPHESNLVSASNIAFHLLTVSLHC
jgi:tubulin polyglutamylase TTLL7